MVLSENSNKESNYYAHKCIYTGLIFNSIDTLHMTSHNSGRGRTVERESSTNTLILAPLFKKRSGVKTLYAEDSHSLTFTCIRLAVSGTDPPIQWFGGRRRYTTATVSLNHRHGIIRLKKITFIN